MELEFDVHWKITVDGEALALDPLVFELLQGVRYGGHLNYAAKAAGVSYRHAWGLLREWEGRFGKALLLSRQGRGAHLTEFAETLLEIANDTAASLATPLEQAALEAAARLSDASDARRRPLTIVSSHSDRVLALRDRLKDGHRVTLDITGSESALHRYRRGEVDLAGFHLPLGELGRTVAAALIGLLDPSRDRVWLLEERTLGLLSRPDQIVATIAELARSDVRFVNRQSGSGTRLIFDGLLGLAGLSPADVTGYDNEEYTHTAVAALVASNNADVAFGAAEAARQMDLHFSALTEERFYLVMNRESDSKLKRAVADFCSEQTLSGRDRMKSDEFAPTLAVLKRVHNAGFWKATARRPGEKTPSALGSAD